jgi:nucleotide-binding universal stress UspA family protein
MEKKEIPLPDFKKILFPVDLSPSASQVAEYVAMMVDCFKAEVHLIYVAHVTQYYASIEIPETYMGNFEAELIERAKKQLGRFSDTHFSGRPVKAKILSGRPGDEILRYALEERVDLIVMGHHSVGIERVIFGSVAGHVVKYSPVPVLIVSPHVLN